MSSKIEWTTETWNPLAGCSKVSDGCKNCYAIKDAVRLSEHPNPKIVEKYRGTTKTDNGKMNWTGKINLASGDVLTQPIRWTRPRKIFVNSMSDLFHENVPDEWIDKIFAMMALTPQHTYQILTKRPERMRDYLCNREHQMNQIGILNFAAKTTNGSTRSQLLWEKHKFNKFFPLPNVWFGVSVENSKEKHRIDILRKIPAAVLFLSLEPLLEDLGVLNLSGIDWVIVGGESGTGARPMNPDWAKNLRDQCIAANVPFFFKQWGSWFPICEKPPADGEWSIGKEKALSHIHLWNDEKKNVSFKIGKRNAGRFLDGRTWDEFPKG